MGTELEGRELEVRKIMHQDEDSLITEEKQTSKQTSDTKAVTHHQLNKGQTVYEQ